MSATPMRVTDTDLAIVVELVEPAKEQNKRDLWQRVVHKICDTLGGRGSLTFVTHCQMRGRGETTSAM